MYSVVLRTRLFNGFSRQAVVFNCFPKTTTTQFYSSSSSATPKAKHQQADEERINHEDRIVNITKLTIQELQPEIAKIQKLQDDNVKLAAVTVSDDQTKQKTKKKEELAWRITPSPELNQLVNHYLMLSKIRLTSMVVITSMAGYAMAPAPFELSTFLMCSLGTGLLSGAANSINQFFETPFDAQMSRTKNRVLIKGYLTPLHAVGFATVAATSGLAILAYGVNGLTASLGIANLVLYTCIYTPMKRYSILNTWVGSVVGAIPPLMGWAGCSGNLEVGAWIFAGLLYAWQFPHFNALSWNLRPDYSRAGYRMMAVTNPALCRRVALRYTGVIAALSLSAPLLDVTNMWFALESLPLNGYYGYLAWKFYQESDSGSSRKLFRFSLLHLPLLMILFLINKKEWVFKKKTTEEMLTAAGAAALVEINRSSTSDPLSQLNPLTTLLPKHSL